MTHKKSKRQLQYNKRIWFIPYKQKKPYSPPQTEVIETKTEEPIACSYYEDHHIGKPGHGWGDKNHDHVGPPGQNKKNGITDIWEDL